MMTKLKFVCEKAERGRAAIRDQGNKLPLQRPEGKDSRGQVKTNSWRHAQNPGGREEMGADKDTQKGLYQTW